MQRAGVQALTSEGTQRLRWQSAGALRACRAIPIGHENVTARGRLAACEAYRVKVNISFQVGVVPTIKMATW